MPQSFSTHKGFTLVEVLIAVVIVGVLAALAIPAYYSQFCKIRRTAAVQNLLDIKTGQEKFFALNNRYAAGNASGGYNIMEYAAAGSDPVASYEVLAGYVNFDVTDTQYYLYDIITASTTAFTVRARGDLNGDGVRTDCWDIKESTTEPVQNTTAAPCAANGEGLSLSALGNLW